MIQTPVSDLAKIDPVAEQVEQGAPAERQPADDLAGGRHPAFRHDALFRQSLPEGMNRAEVEIEGEDAADGLSFPRVHGQGSRAADGPIIPERHGAAHPHALLLRGRDLVADAFAGHLALELGEGQQNVQREPSHAAGRVEGLGDRDEADLVLFEDFDHAGKIGQRAGQPVDLVDDDDIDLSCRDVGEEAVQSGPFHGAAGEPAVIVDCRKAFPAFPGLASDVGIAGVALGIEGKL